MKSNLKYHLFLLTALSILLSKCETKERLYRPDVSRKLCTLGIIDIDDKTIYDVIYNNHGFEDTLIYSRYISFEKSFQFEFPEEISDSSLKSLTFKISDDGKDIFEYQENRDPKKSEIILPDDINFDSGKKYFLHASEEETPDIYSEVTVPEYPPELELISVKTDIITLDKPYPNTCYHSTDLNALNTEIEFSFSNINPNSYYAILLIGSTTSGLANDPWSSLFLQSGSGLMDFKMIETNMDGFFYALQGRKKCNCFGYDIPNGGRAVTFRYQPVCAYFIDATKTHYPECTFKLSVENQNGITMPGFCKSFRVRLMSIPKELYMFEKSLYTYSKITNDPFVEPVTIEGNIREGNGVFAICRSRELIVYPDTTVVSVNY